MEKDTMLKVGAMHLRFMDDEEQYSKFLANLMYYNEDNDHYTEDVLEALEDGLENYSRYQKFDNALSPRFIRIEKRIFAEEQELKANDTEGAYHVIFHFDDEKEEIVHFKRKQDQLLYMLILLTSVKSGCSSEFFRKPIKEDYKDDDGNLLKNAFDGAYSRYKHVKSVILKMMDIVYPNGDNNDSIIMNLEPKVYFTDTIQKMRSAIRKLMKDKQEHMEERWFVPYTLNVGKKRVYQMHLEPTKIIYPEEFQTIIDELPLADDYVDLSSFVSVEMQKRDNEILLKEALNGNVKCMNQLARAYNDGIGRVADKSRAFSLWKKTADMGDSEGLYYMGVFYGTGDVVSQDYTISTQYLQKSADLGYAEAFYQLGVYKMHGFGCKANWEEALEYYKTAASKGCADAANEVGYIYKRGDHGVKKDDKQAFEWFLKAAELNHTEAIRYVIGAYHDGIVEDEDGKKYLYWVKKGFELDIPEVYLQVGLYLFQNKEYESAFPALAAASEKGLISPNHILALMLINGLGVEQNIDEAVDYLTRGAYEEDESCLNLLREIRPELWKKINSEIEDVLDMRSALVSLVSEMRPIGKQNDFLDIINVYRECFYGEYQKEINRQLSIHKPSTDGSSGSRRKIVVRKSNSKKARYEIVIIMANGEEQILNLNPHSLVLMLLTIICSFKSGYNTVMALDANCRSVMAELVRLVFEDKPKEDAKEYVSKYMTSPKSGSSDSYKTYSNFAKQSIEKAIGECDDAFHFLFDNNETIGKRPLRSMNIDVNDIELPQELAHLAQQMPDGRKILYSLKDE